MLNQLKQKISKKEAGKLLALGLLIASVALIFSFRPDTSELDKVVLASRASAKAFDSRASSSEAVKKSSFLDLSNLKLQLPKWNFGSSNQGLATPPNLYPIDPVDTSNSALNRVPKNAVDPEPKISTPLQPSEVVPKDSNAGQITQDDLNRQFQTRKIQPDVTPATGKIQMQNTDKFKVVSDKFPVGTSVNVKVGNKSIDLIVDNWRFLDSSVILLVNSQIFQTLGGDVNKATDIEGIVKANYTS